MDPDFINGLESYVWEGQQSVERVALDSYVVCLGTQGSGKGTILSTLGGGLVGGPTSRSSMEGAVGKPTLGMEYMYIRSPPREGSGGGSGGGGVSQPPSQSQQVEGAPATPATPTSTPLYRELAHVWELGGCAATGGAAAAEWLQIPVTPQRLPANVLLLVLDCGAPLDLCSSALAMLAMVRKRVEECCDKLHKAVAAKGASGSGGEGGGSPASLPPPEALYTMARARQCVGRAGGTSAAAATHDILTWAGAKRALEELPPHPDAATPLYGGAVAGGGGGGGGGGSASPTLLPFPAIFIASKWDTCMTSTTFSSPAAAATARCALLGALRYLALTHGAALVAWSKEDKASSVALKGLFQSAAFGGPIPQQHQHQHQQQPQQQQRSGAGSGGGAALPFYTWGQDSLGEIVASMEREGLVKPGMDAPSLARGDRPLEERLQGFAAGVREGWAGVGAAAAGSAAGVAAAAAGGGGKIVGEGGVGRSLQLQFPENAIDALVAAKEAAAAAERDAKERERRMEAAEKRAAKAAGGGGGGGGGGGAGV